MEGIKLSRDSSMSVQRLKIIIYYRTCAVCSFKRFAYSNGFAAVFVFSFNNSTYQNLCALALGVSPLPRILWAVGGSSLGFTVDALVYEWGVAPCVPAWWPC